MKRLFFPILLALMLFSCKEATFIGADKENLDIPRQGDTVVVSLNSDVPEFEVKESPEWAVCTIEGDRLTVIVGVNDSKAKRDGHIIIGAPGKALDIPIAQGYAATVLEVESDKLDFEKDGGSKELTVNTDGSPTIEAPEWVTAQLTNGKLMVTATACQGSARSGQIKLSDDTLSVAINVKQQGDVCARCKGTGKITCPKCHGKGHFSEWYDTNGGFYELCKYCGGHWKEYYDAEPIPYYGTGRVKCPDCGGTGK